MRIAAAMQLPVGVPASGGPSMVARLAAPEFENVTRTLATPVGSPSWWQPAAWAAAVLSAAWAAATLKGSPSTAGSWGAAAAVGAAAVGAAAVVAAGAGFAVAAGWTGRAVGFGGVVAAPGATVAGVVGCGAAGVTALAAVVALGETATALVTGGAELVGTAGGVGSVVAGGGTAACGAGAGATGSGVGGFSEPPPRSVVNHTANADTAMATQGSIPEDFFFRALMGGVVGRAAALSTSFASLGVRAARLSGDGAVGGSGSGSAGEAVSDVRSMVGGPSPTGDGAPRFNISSSIRGASTFAGPARERREGVSDDGAGSSSSGSIAAGRLGAGGAAGSPRLCATPRVPGESASGSWSSAESGWTLSGASSTSAGAMAAAGAGKGGGKLFLGLGGALARSVAEGNSAVSSGTSSMGSQSGCPSRQTIVFLSMSPRFSASPTALVVSSRSSSSAKLTSQRGSEPAFEELAESPTARTPSTTLEFSRVPGRLTSRKRGSAAASGEDPRDFLRLGGARESSGSGILGRGSSKPVR